MKKIAVGTGTPFQRQEVSGNKANTSQTQCKQRLVNKTGQPHQTAANQIVPKFFLDPHLRKCRWGTPILGISTLWCLDDSLRYGLDGLVYWRICASRGLDELIAAIQWDTWRDDDGTFMRKGRRFNVMMVHNYAMYSLGKFYVYQSSTMDMIAWYRFDVSFKPCLCYILRYHCITLLVNHYNEVIIGAMASQINRLTIVYSTVYLGAHHRKHQSSASLAFVRGIHRWPVNSPHKGPVTWKMFPFHNGIMFSIMFSSIKLLCLLCSDSPVLINGHAVKSLYMLVGTCVCIYDFAHA